MDLRLEIDEDEAVAVAAQLAGAHDRGLDLAIYLRAAETGEQLRQAQIDALIKELDADEQRSDILAQVAEEMCKTAVGDFIREFNSGRTDCGRVTAALTAYTDD